MGPDPDALAQALEDRFGGPPGAARTVARMAVDLADSGKLECDLGEELDVALVVDELADGPDGSPAERWNWWIGSLEVAFGGYEDFAIRRYRR